MKDLAKSTGIENYEIKIVIGWLVRKKNGLRLIKVQLN